MPTLQIFGVGVVVSHASSTSTLSPGLTLTAALAPDERSIAIALDGSFGQVSFAHLAASLRCAVNAGAIVLTPGPASASGTVRVRCGDVDQSDSGASLVVPAVADAHGFDIGHHSATAQPAIEAALDDDDILKQFAGYLDLDRWIGSLVRVRIDRATVALVLEDQRPELRLDDRFGAAPSLLQHLRLREARLSAAGFTLHAVPRNHALFLHPDILDGASAIDARENAMLFQHVLAGVEMAASYEYGDGLWSVTGWQIAPDSVGGCWTMAVGAYQDEQGHPLMLQSHEAVPLSVRWGLDRPDPGAGMNRAIVLGTRARALAIPVSVVSADPAALYGQRRFPAPMTALRQIPAPYWIVGGLAAVVRAAPRELNGIARNIALRTADSGALSATLRLSPQVDGAKLLAMLPALAFDASTGMALAFDVPEQSVLAAGAQLERRLAIASGEAFALPLLDVRWAFGDLACKGTEAKLLAQLGAGWIDKMDRNLTEKVFSASAMRRYEHTGGHRAQPVTQSFARLLPVAPVSTGAAAVRLGERMAPVAAVLVADRPSPILAARASVAAPTQFLFGGPDDGVTPALDGAGKAIEFGRTALGDGIEHFHRFWAGVEANPPGIAVQDWRDARRALRAFLAGEPIDLKDPGTWELEQLMEASARLEAARAVLAAGAGAVMEFDGLAEALEGAMPDEVEELRNPAQLEGTLARLFQFAFAPPSMAFLKRAVSCVLADPPPPEIVRYTAELRTVVTKGLGDALDAVFRGLDPANRLEGMFAELAQGIAGPYAYLADIWSDPRGALQALVQDLRDTYGPVLTKEVLDALLASPHDAQLLLEALQGLGFALTRLDDLTADPPDYLLVTRRLRRSGTSDPGADTDRLHPIERAAALWNHRFDFCTFGGGKAWDLFLDDDTTLVVKLGTGRPLDAILTELHHAYQAPQREDPFGLAGLSDSSGDPLQNFIALLPAPLLEPSWCGVLIINPMIDLERDQVLTTLCGFPHIAARYAAVGGARPERLADVQLDVWGRIENYAVPDGWSGEDGRVLGTDPDWGKGDVGWSMTRFEASIKNTTVLSGEVAFRLEVRELFGRRLDDMVRVNVAGTLPPMPSGQSAGDKPREFVFVGTLEKPLKVAVEVAFIEALQLRGVRVGSHDGDTTLDIDADLLCREWPVGGFKFDLPKGPVSLSDVRIRMPSLEGGLSLPMGLRRALSIDLGAIRFPVMQERHLTIAGIEIRPVGVGMLRGTAKEVGDELEQATMTLAAPDFSAGPGARYVYPFLDTRVDFGKAASLGGGGQLSLVARVGTPIAGPGTGAQIGRPGAGLASLSGHDLKLDLFRLLTIEASRVEVKIVDVYNPDTGIKLDKAGTFAIDGFNLKVGGWSLFAETDDRRLLMAHTHSGARGMLAWYAAPASKSGFFRLQWLLVSRNLDPGKDVKNKLLALSPPDLRAEIEAIGQIMPSADPGRLNALVEKDAPWLFGVRFELGELFKPCSLVLHDGRYYGIRLGGIVARLLTGDDDFSFAYIPGPAPEMDRFRTTFRCAALDMIATMRSGDMALEWSPNWDFLIDAGQPWRGPSGYQWERAFSMPVGVYEAKFGFFVEKRTSLVAPRGLAAAGDRYVTFSAGAGFYLGYFFELNAGIAWVRAGIGIFGVMIGSATLKLGEGGTSNPLTLLRGTLVELRVVGVIGIYAYGEGGVEVWVLSARFRVSAQAFVEVTLIYVPNARSLITWNAMLSASYSASVRIGSGWFSWTFSVSGSVQMQINGQAAFG